MPAAGSEYGSAVRRLLSCKSGLTGHQREKSLSKLVPEF